MITQFKGYIISSHTSKVETDQQGTVEITRWRVSQIDKDNSEIKRILRDGFESEEQATAYADELYERDNPQAQPDQ